MFIKVKKVESHGNGISGEPFHVVMFEDPGYSDLGDMVGFVFESEGHVAVMNVGKLAQGDIGFGSNSWRGDHYERTLRRAIEEHRKSSSVAEAQA